MVLCYGVLIKILNLWKQSKRNPSQKHLQNTILSSIYPPYTRSGITDSVSTDLARCKQGLANEIKYAAIEAIDSGKAKKIAAYFQKKLIDSGFLKSDEKSANAIVSLLLDVIGNDDSIPPSTVVDKVSGVSKQELLMQHDFVLSDFLSGIFLYTVSNVDNRIGMDFSSQINENFVHKFTQRNICVYLQPVLPIETNATVLPPEVEKQILLCNRTLYDAQNKVRVYGSWDELDFDTVYVPPYLYNKSLHSQPDIPFFPEPPKVAEKPMESIKAPPSSHITRDTHSTSVLDSPNIIITGTGGAEPIIINIPSLQTRQKLESYFPQLPNGNLQAEHSISERWERISSVFEENDVIYVIGGAGYGKSLFLKNLCVNPSILKTFDEKPLLIIRGDIKRLIRPDGRFKAMMEFLEECFVHGSLRSLDEMYSSDFLKLCLKAGRCLILLDALDEVGNDQRSELHHRIISYFRETYPHNKVCITSRERGFIPKRNITCFHIAPITTSDIEEYVDRFIQLRKFDANEKSRFVEQASVLISKEFIKGFLTLSLLVAIYKNEQQLPVNKLQLYQKCFEYMATHRERDKSLIRNSVTGEKYDWIILLRLMSDATFMELARLGAPNNTDIPDDKIKALILSLYQMKFDSEGECHAATEMFLQFCADRTEIFIPSPHSNLEYRFFHRSFYEYFYAKSIDAHTQTVAETYRELRRFDVDSEVFELLLTIYDLSKPLYLRDLVLYAFEQAETLLAVSDTQSARAFDTLLMMMPVIDDKDFIKRLILLLLKEGNRIGKLPLSVNFEAIGAVIKKDISFLTENLYTNQTYLLEIQSWLIHDFLKRESCYRNLLLENHLARLDGKKKNGFAYSALLSLLPKWDSILDDWFVKFSNAKYLLGVKKLRSYQAERLASFAKDLIDIEAGKRLQIYNAMLSEI